MKAGTGLCFCMMLLGSLLLPLTPTTSGPSVHPGGPLGGWSAARQEDNVTPVANISGGPFSILLDPLEVFFTFRGGNSYDPPYNTTEPGGIAAWSWSLQDGLYNEIATGNDTDFTYTFDTPGLYFLNLTVWDAAGNQGSQVQEFRVWSPCSCGIHVYILYPTLGARVNGTVNISGYFFPSRVTGEDVEINVTIVHATNSSPVLHLPAVLVPIVGAQKEWYLHWNTTGLPDGDYRITLAATEHVNYSNTVKVARHNRTITVEVDNIPDPDVDDGDDEGGDRTFLGLERLELVRLGVAAFVIVVFLALVIYLFLEPTVKRSDLDDEDEDAASPEADDGPP